MICPFCGGENPKHATSCAWCHAELVDLSHKHYQNKRRQVLSQLQQLKRHPLNVALIIGCVFLCLALLLGLGGTIYTLSTGKKLSMITYEWKYHRLNAKLDRYYTKRNYDGLENLLIDHTADTIGCPKYAAYKRALFMKWYGDQFNEGEKTLKSSSASPEAKNKALIKMCDAYKWLYKDRTAYEECPSMHYVSIKEIDSAFYALLQSQKDTLQSLLTYDIHEIERNF